MLAAITHFFENHLDPGDAADEENDIEHKLQLASAALMIELCKADQEMDEAEIATLLKILRGKFNLSKDTLDELMSLAEQEAREATSLFQFTSLFNDHYGYEEKVLLIRHLWEVAFADGRLDRYEEHLVRKIAELLYVSHNDFIGTKLSVKRKQQ